EEWGAHGAHPFGLHCDGAHALAGHLRMFFDHAREERAELMVRGFEGRARGEATDHLEIVGAAAGGFFWREAHREPDIAAHRIFALRHMEIPREDADDGGRLPVESYRMPDDVGVAIQLALPRFVAQHHDWLRAARIVSDRDQAALSAD